MLRAVALAASSGARRVRAMSALPEVLPSASDVPPVAFAVVPGADLPEGTLLAGRYRVGPRIGQGGMSAVYLGHDERLGRDVAIKVLNPAGDAPPPPLREERVSSALIHNHIVSIFDAGEIPQGQPGAGRTFIVMQHVPGTTAHDIAPVPCDRAIDIVRQACEGLAAAHDRGIIHCDVKPGNLLIEPSGRVLIADFGVAASVETEVGDFIHGSPAYIAPERLTGATPDPRFDVYGLGGVLAFLLTGEKPATETSPELPSICPTALRDIVMRARHSDPNQRYVNARELAVALDRMSDVNDDRVLAEEPTLVVRPSGNSPAAERESAAPPVRRVERVHTPRPSRVIRQTSPDASSERRQPIASGTIEMPSPFGNQGQPQQSSTPVTIKPAQPRIVAGPSSRHARLSIGRFGTVLALIAAMVSAMVLGGMLFGGSGTDTSSAAGPLPVVAMPDTRGQTFGTAVQMLADQGLTVDRVEIIYDEASLNEVIVQIPVPATEVTQEDEIVLIVRSRQ